MYGDAKDVKVRVFKN